MFNPDALVAGAERTIFLNLRRGWDAGYPSLPSAAQDDFASTERWIQCKPIWQVCVCVSPDALAAGALCKGRAIGSERCSARVRACTCVYTRMDMTREGYSTLLDQHVTQHVLCYILYVHQIAVAHEYNVR